MLAATLLVTALAGPAIVSEPAEPAAQQEPSAGHTPARSTGAPPAQSSDQKLPVSLSRIRRQLQKQPIETERFEDFRLLTSLHVYGQAPQFQLFAPSDDPRSVTGPGPIRYGGMTHKEFLQQVTPRNFQAPVMNLSSGMFSLANWMADKKREAQRRKEIEARKRAQESSATATSPVP